MQAPVFILPAALPLGTSLRLGAGVYGPLLALSLVIGSNVGAAAVFGGIGANVKGKN